MTQIDFSRYLIVKAITERFAAGESVYDIGQDFFDGDPKPSYTVELVVAAADREGKYVEGPSYGEAGDV